MGREADPQHAPAQHSYSCSSARPCRASPPTRSRAISLATPANSSASRSAAEFWTVASTSYSSAFTVACASQERSKCCREGGGQRG